MGKRSQEMPESAAPFVPARPTLRTARQAAATCTGCDLYRYATQTVFGEGRADAAVMFVGEEPGHAEDIAGKPFVGPAGRVLDQALEAAGIARNEVYVTNVVKHFKWEPRGKRRIHVKPRISEIRACRPWLETELALVKPRARVCLGATAAQALLGSTFKVSTERGKFVESPLAPLVMATVHPSSVLRAQTDDERHRAMEELVADLRTLAKRLSR
ncbi:MAG TPA: UdgX family uracil-DNA binding protein [Vicinamibacterales bacterium]|nr:UdgX family uracil-DNA binding protein [Vicinamibacterales bacterium]